MALSFPVKSLSPLSTPRLLRLALGLLLAKFFVLPSRADDRLVGRWVRDEGFQIVQYVFRSDGRYQLDRNSTDPLLDFSSTDRGRYTVVGQTLTLVPFEFLGEPTGLERVFELNGTALVLSPPDHAFSEHFQFEAGSREDVLAKEKAAPELVGTWLQYLPNVGLYEYTFRPGGYYFLKKTPEDSQFPPEYLRGRYALDGTRLTLRPYSGVEAEREMDFFGTTLTLIRREEFSGGAEAYELAAGSREEVQTKSAEAEAFLARAGWQVGTWEVRDPFLVADVTFRPDGRSQAIHTTEFAAGTVRGRYELSARQMRWQPFPGQEIYARANGEFGKEEKIRALDYYDGELQFIDLGALSQHVVLARKRPGSEAAILEKAQVAAAQRAVEGWHIGIWEVHDPAGWMRFTFRPDQRYLAEGGTENAPSQVERGRYLLAADKLTLSPYSGLGAARGFELDLFDGDLLFAGDSARLVVARKVAGSEVEVIAKTRDPLALKGERGGLLGRWSAPLPGISSELVLRPDGEFRLDRCANQQVSRDYGLFAVDLERRKLLLDSRLSPAQTLDLDFYGDTLTLYGGVHPPATYRVNLGSVDADVAASLQADADREGVDDSWLARVPIVPRDPGVLPTPSVGLPPDPLPSRIFEDPTVLAHYQLYRRLIPGFVYFNDNGVIKSVAIVNTREWHFFPTGRVLVRFKNYYPGAFYPTTFEEVSDSWAAYRVEPKSAATDVLHRYADNVLRLDSDLGEQVELSLEDGRRHLFWDRDYQLLSEWATEQKPVACALPDTADARLMNTGVRLSTGIAPDPFDDEPPVLVALVRDSSTEFTVRGRNLAAGSVVVERAASLVEPAQWRPISTNDLPAGPFAVKVSAGDHETAFFRLSRP